MRESLNSLRLRIRALLRRRQLERDLQDELAFHVAMREEQLRAGGAADADAVARRRFGSAARIREELRDTWAVAPRVGAFAGDLRYAARALRRSPTFACVIVLTLGLGIGANTAFFSVVNAVLMRPLGYPAADRLVLLQEGFPEARVERLPFSPLDFEDLRRYQQSFESVAAYRNVPFELTGRGAPERVAGTKVSADLFRTLGIGPAIGRTFSAAEDRPAVRVAILSWGLWQRRYAANPSIVGERILLDRQPYTVVGIMPERFMFPWRGPIFNGEPADVWVPIAFSSRERLERGSMHNNSVIGRLKAGVAIEAARAELAALAERIAASYPPTVLNAGFSPRLFAQPLRHAISGRLETPLLLLLAAVGLVLLVACANVANLVLSRIATRTREFAVRAALGARQAQITRLLLCEALLLSAAGGAVGVTSAYAAIKASPAVLMRTVPGLHELAIDLRVLAFTAAMCLGTAVVFAVVPLATLDRRKPGDFLKEEPSRTTPGTGKLRLQRGFVVVTVTFACVLLVGAGLLMKSFAALVSTDMGFRPAQVLIASMTLPRMFYATAGSVRTFYDSLYQSLSRLPGAQSVTLATDFPLTSYELQVFTPEGTKAVDLAQRMTNLTWVHGPYFETLGIGVRRGRFFGADEHVQNRRVVIVNERLAALAWPGDDPIGKRLKWGTAESAAPWLTVVGVIRNVADGPPGREPGVHAYEPFRQFPDFFLDGAPHQFGRDLKAAVLADGRSPALAALVRQEIATLDPDLAIESIQSMEQQVSDIVAPRRFSTLVVSAFAAVALLLASIGLYGLLAFTMAQRRREIAVRLALGAEPQAVVRMVIGEGARLVAVGLIGGFLGSFVLTRMIASLLYQTSPYDLATFVTVPAVLGTAACAACVLPAWRAARVDVTAALRVE